MMPRLTKKDIQEIAKELDIQPTPELSKSLMDIADNHFILRDWVKNREPAAEARTDLKKISNQTKKLISSSKRLGPLAKAALTHGNIKIEHTIEFLRQFQNYAENGIELISKEKSGSKKNEVLILTIENLGMPYHAATGKMPGISTNWENKTRSGPFLRFVIAFLQIVEPEIVAKDNAAQIIGELIKNNLKNIKSLIEPSPRDH
jgi:hypothetical protein